MVLLDGKVKSSLLFFLLLCISQAGLELTIPPPQVPNLWDHTCAPMPHHSFLIHILFLFPCLPFHCFWWCSEYNCISLNQETHKLCPLCTHMAPNTWISAWKRITGSYKNLDLCWGAKIPYRNVVISIGRLPYHSLLLSPI